MNRTKATSQKGNICERMRAANMHLTTFAKNIFSVIKFVKFVKFLSYTVIILMMKND